MDVRNCKKCRKLFNYIGGQPMCPSCMAELEDEFQKVKTYLRDNPNALMVTIAEVNEVSVQQIKQWVREERLTFTEDSPVGIECEKCGAMIRTGRYCNQCKSSIANGMKEAISKPKVIVVQEKKSSRDKERMRFLDK